MHQSHIIGNISLYGRINDEYAFNLIAQQANDNKGIFNDKDIEYSSSQGTLNMDFKHKISRNIIK